MVDLFYSVLLWPLMTLVVIVVVLAYLARHDRREQRSEEVLLSHNPGGQDVVNAAVVRPRCLTGCRFALQHGVPRDVLLQMYGSNMVAEAERLNSSL